MTDRKDRVLTHEELVEQRQLTDKYTTIGCALIPVIFLVGVVAVILILKATGVEVTHEMLFGTGE